MSDVLSTPLEALIAHLAGTAAIVALAGTRVYGMELPRRQGNLEITMPSKTVVVKPAGGPDDNAYVPTTILRVDVFNYGETQIEALELQRATHEALKYINRLFQGTTLIHWAQRSGGPIWSKDPDGNWPVVIETWNVMCAEYTTV